MAPKGASKVTSIKRGYRANIEKRAFLGNNPIIVNSPCPKRPISVNFLKFYSRTVYHLATGFGAVSTENSSLRCSSSDAKVRFQNGISNPFPSLTISNLAF